MKHKTCHCQIESIPDQDARLVRGNRAYGGEKIKRRCATFFAELQGGKVVFCCKNSELPDFATDGSGDICRNDHLPMLIVLKLLARKTFVERLPGKAKQRGGNSLVASGLLQGLLKKIIFGLFQGRHRT